MQGGNNNLSANLQCSMPMEKLQESQQLKHWDRR